MTRLLIFIWWMVVSVDGVGSLLAVLTLRKIPIVQYQSAERLIRALIFLFIGLTIEAFFSSVSIMGFPREYLPIDAYVGVRILGRTVKAAAVWYVVVYLMGIRNGK